MTMGNGGAKGTGISPIWINVNPLMIQRDVREIINTFLRDFEPVRRLI